MPFQDLCFSYTLLPPAGIFNVKHRYFSS